MPKVKGPLFSLKASGTYQGLIVYVDRSNAQCVRAPAAKPTRQSTAQALHRANVAAMAATWKAIGPAARAAWNAAAPGNATSGRAYFWAQWFAQSSDPAHPPAIP